MTMLALMLAPAYKGFGDFDGFGLKGSLVGSEYLLPTYLPTTPGGDSARTSDYYRCATIENLVLTLPPTPCFALSSPFLLFAPVILGVVIGTGCYFLVSAFRAQNAKNFLDAVTKKKAADAKLAAGGYNFSEEGGGGSERDNINTPLMR